MKKIVLSYCLLLLASSAFAHRLNEYLVATTISLSQDKIALQLRLTPGVAVAADVLKVIDYNHDNVLSTTEQHRYAAAVKHNLTVIIDGRTTALRLTALSFPTSEAVIKGAGDIIITFEAPVSAWVKRHQLQFTNVHSKAVAVYLVNCLLPADADIQVTGQMRNADQSYYQLDFTTDGSQAVVAPSSLIKTDDWATVKTYLVHGVHHILSGYDHLLFLCALVLGAVGLWDLIKIVTAFTLAHSITLTLAVFGLAHLPEAVVEPIIAASIVFVAVQNIVWPKQAGGRIRLAVAFFFGLFHGLGFAGGLLQLMHAMPAGLVWYAILGFSLGVEAGNQLILIPLYTITQLFKRRKTHKEEVSQYGIFQRYASGVIAIAGMYYLIVNLLTALI